MYSHVVFGSKSLIGWCPEFAKPKIWRAMILAIIWLATKTCQPPTFAFAKSIAIFFTQFWHGKFQSQNNQVKAKPWTGVESLGVQRPTFSLDELVLGLWDKYKATSFDGPVWNPGKIQKNSDQIQNFTNMDGKNVISTSVQIPRPSVPFPDFSDNIETIG